jgi:hypothetical protein
MARFVVISLLIGVSILLGLIIWTMALCRRGRAAALREAEMRTAHTELFRKALTLDQECKLDEFCETPNLHPEAQ